MLAGCAGNVPAGRRYAKVIDAHAHWYPREFVRLLETEGEANGAKMGRDDRGNTVVKSVPGSTQTSVLRRNMIEPELLLKEMAERGIDMYVLSMTNPMVYWAPPEFGLKLSQLYNDCCAAAHEQYPQRFVGMMMAPMQAPELAVQEIERAAKLPGVRGLYMATHVNGKNLDDESLFPVYAACERLGLPIFLHPMMINNERLKQFYLINLCGNQIGRAHV